MANLRANKIVSTTGSNAITGSVEFDGTTDYMDVAASSDFAFGTGDFTIEGWIYTSTNSLDNFYRRIYMTDGPTGNAVGNFQIAIEPTTGKLNFWETSGALDLLGTSNVSTRDWNHIAACRSGSTLRLFVNGVLENTTTYSTSVNANSGTPRPRIGNYDGSTGSGDFQGFISNLRIVKGTALYTDNFIPPTAELKNIPGTVLLCCQNSSSATQEATGKTITVNGNATARNFTPAVGSDGYVEFLGPTKINTENYFYLPTGNTETRFPNFAGVDASSARGVFAGGYGSPFTTKINNIDYITISSTGNSSDFGDLSTAKSLPATAASPTRGVIAGGQPAPAPINTIEYVTISSTGDVTDFGDLITSKGRPAGCSNSTRGIFAGGYSPFYTTQINSIEYVTISSTGNSFDFGDLFTGRYGLSSCSSPTRGVFAGGSFATPIFTSNNSIEYITIASTGNALDFGDLSANRRLSSSCSNSTRGLFGGGIETPSNSDVNTIEYITIASLGNVNDFGDLTQIRRAPAACSSSSRAVFSGGYIAPANLNVIDYVTILSTGNASDFGDLSRLNAFSSSFSNGHGGLG